MAFPSTSSLSPSASYRRSGLLALLLVLLLFFLSFQVVVHVRSIRSAVSLWLFSDHHQMERQGPGDCPGCGDLQDVDDVDKTIAYTDQDGRIKLFKVTARESYEPSCPE